MVKRKGEKVEEKKKVECDTADLVIELKIDFIRISLKLISSYFFFFLFPHYK